MKILVAGSAGFIGSALSLRLLARGDAVIWIDSLNDYYDVGLKQARLARTLEYDRYQDLRIDIHDRAAVAQAGVRYSIENPMAYVDTNLTGFANILEGCRHQGVEHLVYASSSSVYGANTDLPFSVRHDVDHPLSLYAASKKANELMAHTYSHLYRLPTTGLRFFTVYGPRGRPDMALFKFTRAILAGEPIPVFNHGKHRRDFTYIDDIVEGVIQVLDRIPEPDPAWTGEHPDAATSSAPYRLYNIGNQQPVELMDYIEVLERCLGITAEKTLLPLQPGDVPDTYADVAELVRDTGYRPNTPVAVGVSRFVDCYRSYHGDGDIDPRVTASGDLAPQCH